MSIEEITEKLSRFEDLAVDFLAVFAPWLAPIPSAYLVGRATDIHLDWHWSIALIAAIAVESVGVVSIVLSLRLYEWNETKNKNDPLAPLPLALAAAAFYFVVTIILTVLLDVFPEMAKYAPAIFPLLAAIGAANIAMKNGQRRRENEKLRVKLGKKTGSKKQSSAASYRQVTGKLPVEDTNLPLQSNELPVDWRQLTLKQRRQLAHLDRNERQDLFANLAPRTQRLWNQRLDQIAEQNGHVAEGS